MCNTETPRTGSPAGRRPSNRPAHMHHARWTPLFGVGIQLDDPHWRIGADIWTHTFLGCFRINTSGILWVDGRPPASQAAFSVIFFIGAVHSEGHKRSFHISANSHLATTNFCALSVSRRKWLHYPISGRIYLIISGSTAQPMMAFSARVRGWLVIAWAVVAAAEARRLIHRATFKQHVLKFGDPVSRRTRR